MIGYTCKYTPTELFSGFGEECILLNNAVSNFDYTQKLLHPNICSHVKSVVENIHYNSIENFIFVNCCDSLKRAYDAEKSNIRSFSFFMDLPHSDAPCARKRLKAELYKIIDEYEKFSGKSFDKDKFKKAFNSKKTVCNSSFIAVAGARCENELLSKIKNLSSCEVVDLTCSENRNLPSVPEELNSLDELMEWYSSALLSQIPCMRMGNINNRKELINNPYLKGIIYHTVKFCDFYDFEYRELKNSVSVPMIKIETDYTKQSFGQISTRLEAFFETTEKLLIKEISSKDGKYFAGIDSGSTTTNFAVLDSNGKLVASSIVKTGFNAAIGAEKALKKAGINLSDISCLVATGYGRKNISFANESVTEITCHAKGAHFLNPKAKTIIDMGGQDSKVIVLDDNGNIANFVMNDKCAAGTGRFLENMARVLQLSIDEMAKLGLNYSENLTISSMCTVFAESEVVSLIAENKKIDDIVHALNKSVAVKISSLINRANAHGDIIMTGGVGRNKGIVKEIEKQLSESVFVPENPDLCGAIGAALIALGK